MMRGPSPSLNMWISEAYYFSMDIINLQLYLVSSVHLECGLLEMQKKGC